MNKKSAIIILIFLAALGMFFYYFLQKRIINEPSVSLSELDYAVYYGKIAEVDSMSIKLEIDEADKIPLIDENQPAKIIEIIILKETKIKKYTNSIKNKEEFNKEQEQFKIAINKLRERGNNTFLLVAPSPYTAIKLTQKDLSIGEKVRIFANTDGARIYAREIIIDHKSNKKDIVLNFETNNVELAGIIESKKNGILTVNKIGSAGITNTTKKIIITNNTIIIKKIKKTSEQFKKEQADFNKRLIEIKESGKEIINISAPNWYIDENIGSDSFKINQEILIFGIKGQSDGEVMAEKIELIES